MTDTNLIRNANVNAQNALETANKALDCTKELAPSVGQHEVQIAHLLQTTAALAHFLFDAELALIDLLLEHGKPLTEHQQQVLEMREKLQEQDGVDIPEGVLDDEMDPNAPVQLSLVPLTDSESND